MHMYRKPGYDVLKDFALVGRISTADSGGRRTGRFGHRVRPAIWSSARAGSPAG